MKLTDDESCLNLVEQRTVSTSDMSRLEAVRDLSDGAEGFEFKKLKSPISRKERTASMQDDCPPHPKIPSLARKIVSSTYVHVLLMLLMME